MIDALAFEPQFLDHLAPVWRALPPHLRGTFHVRADITDRVDFPTRGIARPMGNPSAHGGPSGRKALVASYGDTKVGRGMGYGDFAFLEHGIAQTYAGDRGRHARHASYSGGVDREDTSLFLVPNEHAASRWRTAYPRAAVSVIGSPRLDSLPAREPGPGPVIAISFHWPAQNIAPEAGTALGHYGQTLGELAAAFTVIGHAHPKGDWPQRMRDRYARVGIPFVADFDDVCRQADLYICDNSSTIYEFAATGRPVLVLNTPMYRKDVEHGLRFWEAASVGINVFCPCDLIALTREALKDDARARRDREAALDIVYAHRSGAASRAVAELVRWAGTREAVAA